MCWVKTPRNLVWAWVLPAFESFSYGAESKYLPHIKMRRLPGVEQIGKHRGSLFVFSSEKTCTRYNFTLNFIILSSNMHELSLIVYFFHPIVPARSAPTPPTSPWIQPTRSSWSTTMTLTCLTFNHRSRRSASTPSYKIVLTCQSCRKTSSMRSEWCSKRIQFQGLWPTRASNQRP